MRILSLALSAVFVIGGAAAADEVEMNLTSNPPTAIVKKVPEQRGLFNLVRGKRDLKAVCGGRDPLNVRVVHTGGDVAAAIFTGILYTPAHLKVTCPLQPSEVPPLPSE
jgi:hypothetical protein